MELYTLLQTDQLMEALHVTPKESINDALQVTPKESINGSFTGYSKGIN